MISDKSIAQDQQPGPIQAPPPVYEEASKAPRPGSDHAPGPTMPKPELAPVVMEAPQQQQQQLQPTQPLQERSAAQIGEEYRAALFAQCAQGKHAWKTTYGPCGIITAVLCFPIGLICLFTDTEEKCDRCGVRMK
ncbi:hypothetical protein VKT23_004810 [Stygiomarasmius scandens]|uniref:Brain protein I3 n=1 Tax=Marasmiellus scandens TaxID=2682957 RepID=A0ABR1JSA4_9AGAR